jgi:hypothetical protein
MANKVKTDNHNMALKLALRKRFLERYHSEARFTVLDCCEGSGRLWKYLRQSHPCDVWGVDMKAVSGRVMVDSRRLLQIDGLTFDVIDIDTYGSPWAHWLTVIEKLRTPATVFLTWGRMSIGGFEKRAATGLGMVFPTLEVPEVLLMKITTLGERMIALAWDRGLRIVEVVEALNLGGSARYIGVRLEPAEPETREPSDHQAACRALSDALHSA